MSDAIGIKVLPQFPASVQASGGVQLIKENGIYKFSANFGDFPPVATLPSDPNDHVPVYDVVTGQTILVPSSQFAGGGGGGGTPSNDAPLMDGAATPGVSALYARGDHVHPTDTSRAAASALPLPATVLPLVESGSGAIGSSARYAREDHVHPASGGGSGDVVGPAGATDKVAARYNGVTGKLVQNSALAIADTTAALSRVGGGGVPIQGMGSNAAAVAAGFVGELIQSTKTIANDIAITNNLELIWNTLPLTAGVWLVGGTCGVYRRGAASPVFIHMHCDHGTGTSIQTSPAAGATVAMHVTSNDPNGWIFPMGIKPYVFAAPTTVNFIVLSNFSGGDAIVYGHAWALRIA